MHELLDRMIDDGMGYGIVEYVELPENIVDNFLFAPRRWEANRTRMELTLSIRKEKGVI